MIKIFHEAPICIFNEIQQYTDGDYALVHLLENNLLYRDQFMEAVENGREVILDNSVIELGSSFSSEKYVEWIEKLKPTWYIVPDTLGDGVTTLIQYFEFIDRYKKDLPGRTIAVAQGKSLAELFWCFETLHNSEYTDMIALPFRPRFYEEIADKILQLEDATLSTLEKWVVGRAAVIDLLDGCYSSGIFTKPVHLLGCALPQEGVAISKVADIDWIYSTDTSNPVIAGIEGVRYSNFGLDDKSKTNIDDVINSPINSEQLENIIYNIKKFREFWNQ